MPLRTTDFKNIKRFEDGEDWIDLRCGGLSKGEADQVRDLTAAYQVDPNAVDVTGVPAKVEVNNRVAQANRTLFAILCVDWSLDKPVTGDAYAGLDEESGRWVDEQIGEVLRERRERAEGKAGSSAKPRRRGTSSGKAEPSV